MNISLPIYLSVLSVLLAVLPGLAASPPKPFDPAAMEASLQKQHDSLLVQRDSVRSQIGVGEQIARRAGNFISAFPPLPPQIAALFQPDCPALPPEQVDALVSEAARRESLEPKLIRAVIRQESGFKPCALSPRGAQGLMQLMPDTAAQLQVADPFDPKQNVTGGAAYLKQMMTKFNGDLKLALSAYNAGPNRTSQEKGVADTPETQDYVASILAEIAGLADVSSPASSPPQGQKTGEH